MKIASAVVCLISLLTHVSVANAQLNPHTPGNWSQGPLTVGCTISFSEVVVGTVPSDVVQSYLSVLNREPSSPVSARLIYFLDDGRNFEEYLSLRYGRNMIPLHHRFGPQALTVASLTIELTTDKAAAGVAQRMVSDPWQKAALVSMPECPKQP